MKNNTKFTHTQTLTHAHTHGRTQTRGGMGEDESNPFERNHCFGPPGKGERLLHAHELDRKDCIKLSIYDPFKPNFHNPLIHFSRWHFIRELYWFRTANILIYYLGVAFIVTPRRLLFYNNYTMRMIIIIIMVRCAIPSPTQLAHVFRGFI